MKRIILLLSTLVIAGIIPLSAQTAAINGFCTNGGKSAVVQGLSSTNKLNQIIPSCTVTVYITGTLTLATIYKDAINTPLSNPFTADNLAATAPGKWLFFAPTGQGYDVVMSGGIPPLTFSAPVTLTDILIGGGGGGGGGCNPIGLNGVLQASNGVGGCTPAYVQVNGTNLVSSIAPNFVDTATVKVVNPGTNQISFNGVSSSPTIQHNDATLAGKFSAGTAQILDFSDTLPVAPSGFVNATFQADTATGRVSAYVPSSTALLQMQVIPPISGQYVIIYPTSVATSGTAPPTTTLTSGVVTIPQHCVGSFDGTATYGFTGALAAQAPWVVPANVTAVYGFAFASMDVLSTYANCAPGPNPAPLQYGPGIVDVGGQTLFTSPAQAYPVTYNSALTALSGTSLNAASASINAGSSGASQAFLTYDVPLLGLIVYYTGTAPPADTAIQVVPPLNVTSVTGQTVLSLDPGFPQSIHAYATANLPTAGNYVGQVVAVYDSTDCVNTTGTATSPINTNCAPVLSGSTYVWAPTTGSGGGGAVSSVSNSDGTLTVSPTTGAVVASLALGHANTWTATQTFSNVKDTGAAAGSGTACLQIDTSGLLSNTGTTCGGGGGGGSNVKVNGGTALTTVNLNSTTPAAGALNQNLAFQVDGSGNTSVEVPYGSASNLGVVKVDGTTITASGGVISAPSNGPVCSGTITLTGATIPGSTAGTNQTVICTGLLTTDNIMLDFNGSPLSTNGFVPASGGPITIVKYPSANTINVTPVNYNSSSVTLGSITLNYRVVRGVGGGGAGNTFPSTGVLLWISASRGIVVIGNAQTATSWSSTSGTVTVTATNTLAANQIVTFDIDWGNACLPATGYKVTSATSSQFVISGTSCGTTTGTGGTFYANSLLEMAREQDYFNGHGTIDADAFSGYTVSQANTDFTSKFKPVIDACVAGGGPCPVVIDLGDQDILNGTALSTIESGLQSLYTSVHTEGAPVVGGSVISINLEHLGSPNDYLTAKALNQWIVQQTKYPSHTTDGEYIDQYLDLDQALWGAAVTGSNVHLNSFGTAIGGRTIAQAFADQGSTQGPSYANVNGATFLGGIGEYDAVNALPLWSVFPFYPGSGATNAIWAGPTGNYGYLLNVYGQNVFDYIGNNYCFGWNHATSIGNANLDATPDVYECSTSSGVIGLSTTLSGGPDYLADLKLRSPILTGLSANPTPSAGQMWWNSTANSLDFYDGALTHNLLGSSSAVFTANAIQYATSTTASRAANAADLAGAIYIADTGAANAYVATLSPAITSYVTGLSITINPANGSTSTTPTLNVNGLGTKTITRNGAAALVSGDIVAGTLATLIYDGTHFQLQDPQTGTYSGTSPIVVSGAVISCPTCAVGSGTAVSLPGASSLGSVTFNGNVGLLCSDTSGSGTAQVCSTSPSITPATGTCFTYTTTTANSGTGLTLNIDSFGAKSVAVASSSGWTTTLVASTSIPANKPMLMCYDGTNMNASGTGYAPASGGSGSWTNITGSGQITATGCTQSASTGGYCSISGSSTSSITLSVIPGTYNALHITAWGEASSGPIGINMVLNGDTSSHYSGNGTFQSGTGSITALATGGQASCQVGGMGAANASASQVDLPFYADTTFSKTATWLSYLNTDTSTLTNNYFYAAGCAWNQTSAVTSVTLTIASGHYVAGTKFIIYGVN